MGAMREQRLRDTSLHHEPALTSRDERYEYLSLTVAPTERVADARARVREHAEYGKWELTRSVILYGGTRRFVMRRRIMRVASTL